MENLKNEISDLPVGKFTDAMDFQRWKVHFKTEVCSNSLHLTIIMSWIKVVEIPKSRDDHMTSQSIEGRSDFPDFENLGATCSDDIQGK